MLPFLCISMKSQSGEVVDLPAAQANCENTVDYCNKSLTL
jgi:hypothetical protein